MRVLAILAFIFSLIVSPCYAADKKADNDEQKRIERVETGVKALLEKEKCALEVTHQIRIVPLKPEEKAEKVKKK